MVPLDIYNEELCNYNETVMEKERRTPQTPSFYLPQLDGLRFVAFLLVFIHNAPYVESNKIWAIIHELGWIGVDIFFFLSAFLITKILIAEFKDKGAINIKSFYIRRVLRIWPLYFFYIIVISCFHKLETDLIIQLAGLSTFTFNIIFLFVTANRVFAFTHLWSISYEEQFYSIVPWLLKYTFRKDRTSKINFIIFIIILGNLLRLILIAFQVKHPAVYILPVTHFESLLLGVTFGLGLFDKTLSQVHTGILYVTGILFLGAVAILPPNHIVGATLILTYSFSGIGASLITTAAVRENSLSEVVFSNKVVIFLGKRSYGLYIFHIASLMIADLICRDLFGITSQQIKIYTVLMYAFGLGLSLLFSSLSYWLIELPFLKLKYKPQT